MSKITCALASHRWRRSTCCSAANVRVCVCPLQNWQKTTEIRLTWYESVHGWTLKVIRFLWHLTLTFDLENNFSIIRRMYFDQTLLLRDIDSPRSKRCEGKFISQTEVSGQSSRPRRMQQALPLTARINQSARI